MNIFDNERALDGHDQLAALMKANIHPPIGETLEFALVELERGRVVFEGSPSGKVLNPIGSVHGGYAATLLDSACGRSPGRPGRPDHRPGGADSR